MRIARTRMGSPRSAFTLIEILIVVAIIALLMALLTATIGKVFSYMEEVRTQSEISQMAVALESLKQIHDRYAPSKIKLSETCNYPQRGTPGTLDAYSVAYLQDMFRDIDLSPTARHDWNGDGSFSGDWILEGDQCLVYFLGGINQNGFYSDKTRPTVAGGKRDGPYYPDFKTQRLRTLQHPASGNAPFPSYLDFYDGPYAYFVANIDKQQNNYSYFNDCQSTGAQPYWERQSGSLRTYHKSNGFQIISAGRDFKLIGLAGFGAGGQYPLTSQINDRDNLTNFASGRLETKK